MSESDRRAADSMAKAGRPPTTFREHYNRFIANHAVAWEVTFAILALVFVLTPNFPQPPFTTELIDQLEISLTLIFAVEFFSRLWAAPDRSSHLKRHLIDAVALFPPVRALRILRLLRLARVFSGFYRAGMEYHALARHRGFISLVAMWIGLGVVCSLVFYVHESEKQIGVVDDPFDAIWWGVGSLSTVGSDLFPVTDEGRLAAIALMVIGVFLFSAITATITSVLLTNSGADETSERLGLAKELSRLADLRDRGVLSQDEFDTCKRLTLEKVASTLV